MKVSEKTNRTVLTALMMTMIVVMTMFMKIPIPMTQGYVHLGDAMIFLAVMILGWKQGAVAAGLGSAMADIFCGAAMWAPWTLVIKFLMAAAVGLLLKGGNKEVSVLRLVLAMTAGGIIMVGGYFAAEGIMYGSWAVAALGIPWNIGQFVAGGVIANVISVPLCQTQARKMFSYRMKKA